MAPRDALGGWRLFRSNAAFSPSKSFEFLDGKGNSVSINSRKIQIDKKSALKRGAKIMERFLDGRNGLIRFSSAKDFYESPKNHQKGKNLLLKMIKNPNHRDYEAIINYANKSSSESLFKAAKKAQQKVAASKKQEVGDFRKISADSGVYSQPGAEYEASILQHPSSPAGNNKARILKLVTEWVIKEMKKDNKNKTKKIKKEPSYSKEEIEKLEQENSFSKIALQKTEKELFFAEAALKKLEKEVELTKKKELLRFLCFDELEKEFLSICETLIKLEEAEFLRSLRQPVHVYNGDVDRDVRL
jgi:hypothetical protein